MISPVLYYDRVEGFGDSRLISNMKMLKRFSDELEFRIEPVSRPNSFSGSPGAEDLILQDEFAYRGVILHSDGYKSSNVKDAALFVFELNDIPLSRIICFYPSVGKSDLSMNGVTCLNTLSGDGYLTEKDARRVVNILKNFIQ